jgi:predicted nucleic acid-binding protein
MSGDCVVDASVGIKLFVAEALSDRADRLFGRLAALPPAQLYVPDLFYAECANILWKYVRRFNYPAANAHQAIADLCALMLAPVRTASLIGPALELALAYDITVYDACYAALARELDLPLVTADAALARKLAGSGAQVTMLDEI